MKRKYTLVWNKYTQEWQIWGPCTCKNNTGKTILHNNFKIENQIWNSRDLIYYISNKRNDIMIRDLLNAASSSRFYRQPEGWVASIEGPRNGKGKQPMSAKRNVSE
jgi:hypothetical protein